MPRQSSFSPRNAGGDAEGRGGHANGEGRRIRAALRRIIDPMTRPILAVAFGVCAMAVAVLALVGSASISVAQDADTVQVRARLQASGSIEFALRADGKNLVPRARRFPAGHRATGWLFSSPLKLGNGAEVQIMARRHENRRVEFAVRTVEPRKVFAPRGRFFPANARVGVWLISTPVSIPPPPEPVAESQTPESPEQSGDSSESVERISGGKRDGVIVNGSILGDPDAPVLIVEYGDPF